MAGKGTHPNRMPGSWAQLAALSLLRCACKEPITDARTTPGWCAPGSGIVGAAVVSNPMCLHASARSLSHPWTVPYLYNLALAIRLRQYLWQHRDALSEHVQARIAQPSGSHVC